jgi:hypothetical protein
LAEYESILEYGDWRSILSLNSVMNDRNEKMVDSCGWRSQKLWGR